MKDKVHKPKRSEKFELERAGVEVVSRIQVLKCRKCGRTWTIHADDGQRLPNLYWICDEGCNDPEKGS